MDPKVKKEKRLFLFKAEKKSKMEADSQSPRFKKGFFLFLSVSLLALAFLGLGIYFLLQPFPGRTNLLILGTAGENHAGGDLTDTNIFLSLDQQTGKILVLSLPRDIWVAPLRAKLNAVYHYQGLEGAKKVVGGILGQPMDCGVVINFSVFTQIIDALGGVEVEVERSFEDNHYPIPGKENDLCGGDPEFGCRYERLQFEAGKQWMDGERALKYVRSRYAEGEEGSDLARNLRQQKLLVAIKDKILSPKFLRNPLNLFGLIDVIRSNVKTDLPQEKYFDLLRLALRFRSSNFKMEVLNDGLLVNPPTSQRLYDGQWVLVPVTGDWQAVREHVKFLISN